MADICMCFNSEHCPRSGTCYRALAKPDEYQTFSYFYKCNCDCGHYWPVKDEEELDKLDKEFE